ncbi:hypothetical protein F5Y01DRAFT_319814 [Xylaria sp. FL0043]|nr:hypothetical protein F5Y01DRAFT_319814 [Xylaria sp. FL0043]
MASLFQSLEAEDLTAIERPIFYAFRDILTATGSTEDRAVELANKIVSICESNDKTDASLDAEVEQPSVEHVWRIMFDMVYYIPPDHEWQDVWTLALRDLAQRDGRADKNSNADTFLWRNLPSLTLDMLERLEQPPGTLGGDPASSYAKWKSLNSFAARIAAAQIQEWEGFAFWSLREALEKQPTPEKIECLVWVASEWIIRCGRLLLEALKDPSDDDHRSIAVGPLCSDLSPVGMERWQFWKKRFTDIASPDNNLGINSATSEHISLALDSMAAAEN